MVKVNGYDFPDDLLYNKHSLWTKIGDDNIATMGITDLAQKNLEEVTYIDIIFEEGESIKINRPFGTIESGKGSITLYSAITGEITEINETLQDEVNLIKEDCYGKGWLVKVKPSKLDEDKEILMKPNSKLLEDWVKEEIARIKKIEEESKE